MRTFVILSFLNYFYYLTCFEIPSCNSISTGLNYKAYFTNLIDSKQHTELKQYRRTNQ